MIHYTGIERILVFPFIAGRLERVKAPSERHDLFRDVLQSLRLVVIALPEDVVLLLESYDFVHQIV